MPPSRKPIPAYRLHKPTGKAVVTIRLSDGSRKDVYLGRYGSAESREAYKLVIDQQAPALATGSHAMPPCSQPLPSTVATTSTGSLRQRDATTTIDQMLHAYWQHVQVYYRDADGKPTTEVKELKLSLAVLRELFAESQADRFQGADLETVRDRMIEKGWCRTLINRRIDRVKRAFKWASLKKIIRDEVYQSLRTLEGLKRGRTTAPESEPVRPVDDRDLQLTLPRLNRHTRAMVMLQRHTGMRPAEVCNLSFGHLDTSGDAWVYSPRKHKTQHHGRERFIVLGPKAKSVLLAFLIGDKPPPSECGNPNLEDAKSRLAAAEAYQRVGRLRDAAALRNVGRQVVSIGGCVIDPMETVFSPHWEREERFLEMRAKRKSKVTPSQVSRRKPNAKRLPAATYHPHAYSEAVTRAAKKAGARHWHPNQLRHTFATEVRRLHGLEAAQVVLGHAQANVTQVYAERDLTLAAKVAAAMG